MTNEEKAKRIAIEIQERIGTSPFSFDSIVEEIMKMAEWKDEQFAEQNKWHKTNDGDLPTENGNYWCKIKTEYKQGSSHYKQHCSDGYCILQWLNKKKQWNTKYTKQEDIIAWCELPKYENE